jgi:hypothetical protein
VVACPGGGYCPAGSSCAGPDGCACDPGSTARRCDGTECTAENPCAGGEWECVAGVDPDPGRPCPRFAIDSRPLAPPPFGCDGAPGELTVGIVAQLNDVWGSSMVACPCDAQTLAAGCRNNAFVHPAAPGYIFYDREFLGTLAQSFGSVAAAAWLLSHEAGHNIQLRTDLQFGFSIQQELSADCLAGYWFGVLACRGDAMMLDLMTAVNTACGVMDPAGVPWFAPGAHGNCEQRAGAVRMGIDSAALGADPIAACSRF